MICLHGLKLVHLPLNSPYAKQVYCSSLWRIAYPKSWHWITIMFYVCYCIVYPWYWSLKQSTYIKLRDMLSGASSRGGTWALFHEIMLTTMPFLLFSANASASDGKQGGGEHATHHTVIMGLRTSVPRWLRNMTTDMVDLLTSCLQRSLNMDLSHNYLQHYLRLKAYKLDSFSLVGLSAQDPCVLLGDWHGKILCQYDSLLNIGLDHCQEY